MEQQTPLTQIIYPEEEYYAFAQLFIDLDPAFEEELEEDTVIEAYNKIKQSSPEITMEQLAAIVPKMANMMKEKMGDVQQEGQQEGKLAALASVPDSIQGR